MHVWMVGIMGWKQMNKWIMKKNYKQNLNKRITILKTAFKTFQINILPYCTTNMLQIPWRLIVLLNVSTEGCVMQLLSLHCRET